MVFQLRFTFLHLLIYLNYPLCFSHCLLGRWRHHNRWEASTPPWCIQFPPLKLTDWSGGNDAAGKSCRWEMTMPECLRRPPPSAHERKSRWGSLPMSHSVMPAHHRVRKGRPLLPHPPLLSLWTPAMQRLETAVYQGQEEEEKLHLREDSQPVTPPVFHSSRQKVEREKCLHSKSSLKFWLFHRVEHMNSWNETVVPVAEQKVMDLPKYSFRDRGRTRPHWIT